MVHSALQQKAISVLHRRGERGVAYYLKTQWRRHVLFALLFFVLTAAAWYSTGPILAAGFFGVWLGRLTRDFQWYVRLANEWETTTELIDWPRVEALAANSQDNSIHTGLPH